MHTIQKQTVSDIVAHMFARSDINPNIYSSLINEMLELIEEQKDEAYERGREDGFACGLVAEGENW